MPRRNERYGTWSIEACAIPGRGRVVECITANYHASAIEALGMRPAEQLGRGGDFRKEKMEDCHRAGAAVLNLLKLGLKPRDIMTRQGF